MATTNVPIPTFSSTGIVLSNEQAILAGVQADWATAFATVGKTLNPALATAQGQVQQSSAYMVANLQAALAATVANVDPMTASGAFQDALGRIYFLTRQAASYATVQGTVTGVAGQVLSAGAQVVSSDGTVWASTADVVYDLLTSSASVTFRAGIAGIAPVAGVDDLKIYQQQANWVGVSNTAASSPGIDVESRVAFETRRQASVSIGGNGTADAVRAAVANVAGVTDLFVYNNNTAAAIIYGTTSFPIPAHSLAIMVTGGTDALVAAAVNAKLDCGCGMVVAAGNGTLITTNIVDSVNYGAPYPTYPVHFVRPANTNVYITVNVANVSTLPATYIAQVQRAVAAAFANGYASSAGDISVPRARVGGQIVAAEFTAPVLALGNVTPVSIFIGLAVAPTSGASVTMGIDQQPVCPATNITVNAIAV